MPKRLSTWAILLWTGFMAVGILAAVAGIGGDCAGLSGNELSSCQSAAWIRGGIGVTLLVLLWFAGFVPLAIVWAMTRPKDNVIVFGPAGQQVIVSEQEAERRVALQGWTYQRTG